MSERVKIKYGDVAPEAKENFVASATDKEDFVDSTELQQYNLRVGNYANPCELYQTILDGSQLSFPNRPKDENMGLWSNSISDADGNFSQPIVLTLQSEGNYSSQGLSLTFDTENNIFPKSLNIKWYQGETLLSEKDFTPKSALYFCRNKVDFYNRVVITFRKMNMPYNRLKLRAIDYGYGTYFFTDELRNIKLIQEIDPLSKSIFMNVCDFTLNSKTDMQYSFQSKQPLSVYFNNELKATVFVEKSVRKGARLWEIKSEDYVGILDGVKFMGGIYTEQNASELLETILTQAKVPFTIAEELLDEVVTGYIPICTCRKAIQKICFAIGAVADTSNSETFNIFKLPTEVSQSIPKSRIMQGQNFEGGNRITEVQVTQHSYVPLTSTQDVIELYNASESGQGANIFVEFGEPIHSLTISGGTIVDSGSNFAIITTNSSSCILSGKPYKDNTTIKSKKNPNILTSDIENIKSFANETLVSSANIDNILNLCYDYCVKTSKVNMSIVDGKHFVKYGESNYGDVNYGQQLYDQPVNVGDLITAETEYLGTLEGRIISATFSLNGGIIVKECEMV